MSNMDRLQALALRLPEAQRVDIPAWDDHPTFRVRGKNFIFCDEHRGGAWAWRLSRGLGLATGPRPATGD